MSLRLKLVRRRISEQTSSFGAISVHQEQQQHHRFSALKFELILKQEVPGLCQPAMKRFQVQKWRYCVNQNNEEKIMHVKTLWFSAKELLDRIHEIDESLTKVTQLSHNLQGNSTCL